jgi:hypothetical protein
VLDDTYLLCSDGLYNEVSEDVIQRKMALLPPEPVQQLLDEASAQRRTRQCQSDCGATGGNTMTEYLVENARLRQLSRQYAEERLSVEEYRAARRLIIDALEAGSVGEWLGG